MDILAWIFGIASIIGNFIVYQQKERRNLLISKLCVDTCAMIHYSCLSAWSGAAICFVALIRSIVFLNENKKWAGGKKWLLVFLGMNIILACLTWKNIFSIFPLLATTGAIFSFWQARPRLTKILVFPISSCMITYDIFCGSYTGLVNEAFAITSATISLIMLRRAGKAENRDPDAGAETGNSGQEASAEAITAGAAHGDTADAGHEPS